MLITAGKVTRGPTERESISSGSRDVYWRGFVYKAGRPAGAESLRELAHVTEGEIPRIAASLKGAYFVAVQDRTSGATYAFTDPSALYHAYYSPRRIGTSFLELVHLEGCAADDADPDALAEFFHCGYLYDDKTLFPMIRKIEATTILRCDPAGRIESLPKSIPDISAPTRQSFDSLIHDFVLAALNDRVSVDITGGSDSRLVAAALAYFGLPFEMATSGLPGVPDLEIGAQVASALDRPFFPTYHSASRTNWDEQHVVNDGLFDVTRNSRMTQLLQDRKSRGITLAVSGVCGELFRDYFWLQDFPLYAGRKPRIARYFSLRMHPNGFNHDLLAPPYRKSSEGLRGRILRRLARLAVPSNTRTYDRLYYYFQFPSYGGCFLTTGNHFLKVGAPYVDREIASLGYNLPRSERIFSRFHRRHITKYSPEAARLPSTEAGATLSSGVAAISADLRRYVTDRTKRLNAKIAQKVLGRGLRPAADDPNLGEELVRALRARKSTQVLADYGVLRAAFDPRSLPDRYRGRIFVLGRLFEELERVNYAAAITG